MSNYTIGLDYGTDSCRCLVVDTATGEEIASAEAFYPRWKDGLYCDPAANCYRQHPLDYIETLEIVVKKALAQAPAGIAGKVTGLSFDTTGSTPVLLNKNGLPLALLPRHATNPDAMFVLWKDHTAVVEAGEINALAKRWPVDYTAYSGGVYSSEWVWAKMLHVLRADPSLQTDAYSWAEHCDWMPALLTGRTCPEEMLRSRCAAGHKAMWNEAWGGLPSPDFLEALDPLLNVFAGHLYTRTYTHDTPAGTLTPEWAARLGLTTCVRVGVGVLDCHAGAIGAQIAEGSFVRVMGTSTCDMMVVSYEQMNNRLIRGICGQADGSILPGMIGLEAGQSAFGDIFAWYKRLLMWPIDTLLAQSGLSVTALLGERIRTTLIKETEEALLPFLAAEAAKIPPGESSLGAVDWLNGRRTPFANQQVTGAVAGLTLGTTAPLLYRALAEAAAYGSRAIMESILRQGIGITEVIGIGGIARKSPFVMQILSDVLGMPVKTTASVQTCALGAAMCAAVAAGACLSLPEAQRRMGKGFFSGYRPDRTAHAVYDRMYTRYVKMGSFLENDLFPLEEE